MMDPVIKDILKTPKLSIYQKEIEDILIDEQRSRKKFYDTMNEGDKVEFIYGEIILHSPVKLSHTVCSVNLLRLVSTFVSANDIGFVGLEKTMISLTRNDYEPDICYFNKSVSKDFTAKQLHFPPPNFIAEILSPSTVKIDRVIKFEDYAAHNVEEYWIIDPDTHVVEQYRLQDGKYELSMKSDNGIIKSFAIENFEIPVESIFDTKENLRVLKNILLNIKN